MVSVTWIQRVLVGLEVPLAIVNCFASLRFFPKIKLLGTKLVASFEKLIVGVKKRKKCIRPFSDNDLDCGAFGLHARAFIDRVGSRKNRQNTALGQCSTEPTFEFPSSLHKLKTAIGGNVSQITLTRFYCRLANFRQNIRNEMLQE